MVASERIGEIKEGFGWWFVPVWETNNFSRLHSFDKQEFPDRLSVYIHLVREIEEGRL